MKTLSRYLTSLALLLGLVACLPDDVRQAVKDCDSSYAGFVNSGSTRGAKQLEACGRALDIADLSTKERILVLFSRSRLHARRGEYGPAVQDVDALAKLDPKSPYSDAGRAFIAQRRGSLVEALALIERAVGADPKNASFLSMRASIKHDSGRYAEAIKDADEALDGKGDVFADTNVMRIVRAMSYVRMKTPKSTVSDDLNHWAKLLPTDYWAYIYRGLDKVNNGRTKDGIADFEQSLKVGAPAALVRGMVSHRFDNLYYFGPPDASFETGTKYGLQVVGRDSMRLTEVQRAERLNKMFPDRVFQYREHLSNLENGLAPMLMHKISDFERGSNNSYFLGLVSAFQESGIPECANMIKSFESLAAGAAAIKNYAGAVGPNKSFLEQLVLSGISLFGASVASENGYKDAVALAQRYGCSNSSVTLNVLNTGAVYMTWSISYKP